MLDLADHHRRVVSPEHRVTERCGEAAEHRSSNQKLSLPGIERVKHLPGQVVGDMTMIACKLAYPRPRILEPAQPQRR